MVFPQQAALANIGTLSKINPLQSKIIIQTKNLKTIEPSQVKKKFLFVEHEGLHIPFPFQRYTQTQNTLVFFVDEKTLEQLKECDFPTRVSLSQKDFLKLRFENEPALLGYKIMFQNEIIGHINEVEIGKNPLIHFEKEGKEVSIPFIDTFVSQIDHKKQIIELKNIAPLLNFYLGL